MPTKLRNSAAPLTLALLMTLSACSSAPLTPPGKPPQTPQPAQELLEPETRETSYSEAVRRLLLIWAAKLTDWREKLALCRNTPGNCV